MAAGVRATQTIDADQLEKARKAKILYVDDDPDSVETFQRAMKRLGLTVDGCLSASDALTLATAEDYSIFALDLRMPEMDGDVLASELGRLNAEASYLLVTGHSDLNLPKGGAESPAISGVLHKPWDPAQLLAALARGQTAYEDRIGSHSDSLRPPARQVRELPILLIEDNAEDADRIAALLRPSDLTGLELVRSTRLRDALSLVARQHFSAVLTDLALPDARGLDAVLALRALNPSLPIVVLSDVCDDALVLQAVKEGAQEYLLKPEVTTATLQRAIRRAVGRKEAAEANQLRADLDPLTGLLTRARFEERLSAALLQAQRERQRVCIMYLDLDRFKQVNDEFGHRAGDEVLREAAQRLRSALRERDTAARLGGDEFAVLIDDIGSEDEAMQLGQRIAAELSRPYAAPVTVPVSASVGIAFYPDDAHSAPQLLERADQAMYRAKRGAHDGVANAREQTREMSILAEDLDAAVAARIASGRVRVAIRGLVRPLGSDGSMVELEPECELGEALLDAGTLRRLSATPALALALHRPLLDACVRHTGSRSERVLVSLSEVFLDADAALELLVETANACPRGRLCIAVPQRWVNTHAGHARTLLDELTVAGAALYVADFGADGGDVLFLCNLAGWAGVCLDGQLLRELSVDRHRACAFSASVQACASALAMDLVVRHVDWELCAPPAQP